VLIGISTKQRSGSSLKELPPIEAKGKTEKLNVFTLT
jgi:hypothetical protein